MSQNGEKFTEFYITGPDGKFSNYSTTFMPGEQKPVGIGIINHEYEDKNYDLVVRLNDSSRASVVHSETIFVARDQTLEKVINITPDMAGDNLKLTFELYIDGNLSVPHRICYLWISMNDT
jgi:uncharacterized membrane protein